MAEGLKASCQVLGEFETILIPSFGPFGKDVLMKSDTGVTYLSKEGDFVLQHLQLKHPVGRMIKDTISQYFISTGDFSKTLLILLAKFLKTLSIEYLEKGPVRTDDKIVDTLSSLSASICHIRDYLRDHFDRNMFSIQNFIEPAEFLHSYVDRLLEVSFFGSVSGPIKEKFLKLTHAVFQQKQFDCKMLGYIDNHLQEVCVPIFGVPFEHSRIVDGCIIQRESKPANINIQNVKFIVVAGESSGDLDKRCVYKLSTELIGDGETVFHKQLVNILQEQQITCIFSENAISNKLETLLSKLSIVLVCHVLLEDLERLSHRYRVSILSGFQDILNVNKISKTIGSAKFIRSIILGKSIACNVGPSLNTIRPGILNIEILLCSQSQGLLVQYQRFLHNVFKVLKQAYDENLEKFVLVPAGGAFEIYISKLLKTFKTTDDIEKKLTNSLSNCFLEIPKLLYEKSRRRNNERFVLGLEENMNNSLKCVDVLCGKMVDVSKMNFYEPAASKIKLVYTFLEFSAQIIKIQNIIPVVKSIDIDIETDSDD